MASQAQAPPAAAAQESPYADQAEFDIASAAQKEADPHKKLEKLKEWEQKYPSAKLKGQRQLMMAQALVGIANQAWGKTTPPELLDAGQKAAQQYVDNESAFFDPANKPAQATDQQFADIKKTFDLQVHSDLAWIAYTRKQNAVAEEEFKKVLAIDPNQAQASFWLGTVILRQGNVARYPEVLYHTARSLAVTTGTPLDPSAKKIAEDFLKRAYAGYHGDMTGIDELKAAVTSSALPPAGFHIESVEEIEKKKFANEDEFNKAHPDIALFRQIRTALTADNGPTYFEQAKGSAVPPENIGMFKGKIVSVEPKEMVVNVDNAAGDVTLKFESSLNTKVIEAGTAIEFKGVVESFTKAPYMLALTVDEPKADIKGLPDAAFSPAPAKRAPARKAPGRKKK
ncbi:MAG: hypothetical protein ABJC09_01005 [Terriglobia bacterium]